MDRSSFHRSRYTLHISSLDFTTNGIYHPSTDGDTSIIITQYFAGGTLLSLVIYITDAYQYGYCLVLSAARTTLVFFINCVCPPIPQIERSLR